MVSERNICGCGASSWTRIIAWFQIVGNSLLLIIVIFGLIAVAGLEADHEDIHNRTAVMIALSFTFLIAFCGKFMGIILLKGTNQKRINFIIAWLVYGIIALVTSTIGIVLYTTGSSHPSTLGAAVFSGMLGIGINLFSVICVYIHMREINEGVFIP